MPEMRTFREFPKAMNLQESVKLIMESLPAHKASLDIHHNNHLSCYLTVQEAIDDEWEEFKEDVWVSEEEKQRAIETNECWSLQWYPDTPCGFNLKSASTLLALLQAVAPTEPSPKSD